MSSSMTWSSSTSLKSWTRSKMERNFCQLPGWCPGNFQWQASLLQSEVVSNYFFQSWNINHQRGFAKKLLGATSPWFAKQWSLASTLWIITNAISSWQAVSVDTCSSIVKWFNISKHQIISVSSITLYILSDLLCKCFCRVITLQCFFSLQDKIHPPTLNTYDIFFPVQSNQVCHKLANQKTPNIWILSIFNYHIYFRSKLVILLSFFSVGYDSQHMVLAGKWMYRLEMTFHELLIIKGMSMIRSVRSSWPA